MLRTRSIALLLFVALLVAAISPVGAQILDRPVAVVRLERTVNIGQRAFTRQVDLFETQLSRDLDSEERREVLESMINDELISQAADRDGVDVTDQQLNQYLMQERQQLGAQVSDEQFRLLVEEQLGLPFEDYLTEIRKQLLQQRYIQETQRSRLEAIAEPTEREIQQVYNENVTEFINPALTRFEHIYVDTRAMNSAERESARAELQDVWNGTSRDSEAFESLRRAAGSETAYRSADFGYLPQNDRQSRELLGGDFVDTVFEMEEGELSDVIRSNVGVHVVHVTDSRERRFLDLDDELFPGQQVTVRDNILNYIMNQRLQSEFAQITNDVIQSLRSDAEITVHESRLD